MAKNTEFHKNVGLFVREYTLYPEKLKKERERLKDKMFAYMHKVSVTTVRNYMGSPPPITQKKDLSENEIEKINERRISGESDVKIAREYSMSSSTLSRHCGLRSSIGAKNNKRGPIQFHIPPMEPKKIPVIESVNLTEKQRKYEESWKANCVDSCKSIDISPYKR